MREDGIQMLLERYPGKVRDLEDYRQAVRIFDDRAHAGRVLAGLLEDFRDASAVVLAVPAGGVPVGVRLASELSLPVDVAVVSKITLPSNTEVGCGAVAFDGTVELNQPLIRSIGLRGEQLHDRIDRTRSKVERRRQILRPPGQRPIVEGKTAILVDDGLASGFTMRVAALAVRSIRPSRVIVAVPTAPASTIDALAGEVDEVRCVNIRSGARFAVADAYRNWRDVPETEAIECLRNA
ncbi:MAG: phosphoribosyltransferase [Phycisphaerae bacterium]